MALGSARRGRWLGLGVLLVMSALVAGTVHSYMWRVYLPSFNTSNTPLAGVPRARSEIPPAPTLSRRLVVVILDGVGFDQVGRIGALAPLAARGVLRGTAVEFPSFTSPALVSFVTGAVPRDTGVRLNGAADGVPGLDSIPRVAEEAGVVVQIRSRGWKPFQSLMRPGPSADIRLGGLGYVLETLRGRARGELAAVELPQREATGPARELRFVYVGEPDDVAHDHGTVSREFEEALEIAGTVVRRTVAAIDLEQDSLVVMSDHGHRPEGGHGGVEPVVMRAFFLAAGPFVRRGVVLPDRPLRDVASTLAVLAGLPTPSSNTGRPMLDALERSDEQRALAFAAPFDQSSRHLCTLAPASGCERAAAITARLQKGDAPALREAEALSDELFSARARTLDARAEGARTRRFVLAAALVAALLSALVYTRRRLDRNAPGWIVLLPLVHIAVYGAALWSRGYRPTFSTIPAMSVFLRDSFLAGAFAALIVFLIALVRRGGPLSAWTTLAGTALPFLLLAAWVGSDPRMLPPPVAGLLVFYTAPAVLFGAIGAAALGILAARRGI